MNENLEEVGPNQLMAQMYRELVNALESDRTFGDSYHETVEEGLRIYEIAKAEGRI